MKPLNPTLKQLTEQDVKQEKALAHLSDEEVENVIDTLTALSLICAASWKQIQYCETNE